jgi:hypothetical protein
MMANGPNTKRESTTISRFARFVPLDRTDWLIIVVAVLSGTLVKQQHLLDLPGWFLDWLFPFLLIIAGYKVRRTIADVIEARRKKGRSDCAK